MTGTAGLTTDRLLGAVGRLWPGHDVELLRARRQAGTGQDLIFVPSGSAPRLLVPAGRPAAAASGLRRFSRALSGKERVVRSIGSVALRAGAEGLLADRIRITPRAGAGDSIEQHLSGVLGTEVVVGLGVGSLRANQKPILQVFDERGRCIAYVKVGDCALTARLVRQEGAALAELAKAEWRLLEIPALLHLGSWHDLELLVISALDTRFRPGAGSLLQPPLAPLDELYDRYDEGSAALGVTTYWRELRGTTELIEDDGQRADYTDALDRIEQSRGDELVRLTAWHGDFAPWNLSLRGTRLQLWDWERFATGVPAGLDRVHYVLHTSARAAGFSGQVIDTALAGPYPRHPAWPPAAQELLGVLYLASLSARYLIGSQDPQGAVLRPTTQTVLDALTRHSRRLTAAAPKGATR
ncbi:hypothetical protein Kfla_2732 [Kribbella flavida DSM 17836]|uniref:Aminoglycoside phosphotransferase domain-containing protein n=1 Tax=Kribbella flavida (strain DSM 17836 / JCM 10339 / NBRC 14399) TaxID=479435 RepID=D2PZ03_KRIFD|nr:hypothetical protein [Kribbella flavida]ADB31797.1 hypothetical protein Kfla_2732 [Kribbella flavida DSM 17836]